MSRSCIARISQPRAVRIRNARSSIRVVYPRAQSASKFEKEALWNAWLFSLNVAAVESSSCIFSLLSGLSGSSNLATFRIPPRLRMSPNYARRALDCVSSVKPATAVSAAGILELLFLGDVILRLDLAVVADVVSVLVQTERNGAAILAR